MKNEYSKIKSELDKVSSSFCLAKWQQVTIHLQNGQTHSCHHPLTHKVSLKEIEEDPSALHNTNYKKNVRKQMLEGKRPGECEYCWKIEDADSEQFSDRIFKSIDTQLIEPVSKMPWDKSINPSSLEVSFGNECQFKCAYCAPHISSALMTEYLQFGHYQTYPIMALDKLAKDGLLPLGKDEFNPYVEAFWKWWPSLKKELKVFRITGGEPLINSNTYRFLENVLENPLSHLELAINSNLCVPASFFKQFLKLSKEILAKGHIKKLLLYTSLDTHGKNGEFIRFGMNYDQVLSNVRTFLKEIPEAEISFMSTYNAFSVVNFHKFLKDITDLKKEFRTKDLTNRVHLDIPYLKDPNFLSCRVLTEDFFDYIRADIKYLKIHSGDKHTDLYSSMEIHKLERILAWVTSPIEQVEHKRLQANLYWFLHEYTKRKNISFKDYCPEYMPLYIKCKFEALAGKD